MTQNTITGANESLFATRATVFALIERGVTEITVLETVLSSGAKWDEPDLWDFKASLPWLCPGVKHPDGHKATFDAKVDEIVKDTVSFYNSFGGYLIIGVDDLTRNFAGFDKRFDVAALNQRIVGVTGQSVECVYRILNWQEAGKNAVQIGLLFVPRRPANLLPAQFKSDARKLTSGKSAFKKGDFYLRQRDECRPAQSGEDYAFLFSDQRRKVHHEIVLEAAALENNLPDRDGELGKFIGRENDISALWEWLADKFSPVRLICGLGGLGKTSLAYYFAEIFVYSRPAQFDKLIWLSAKQKNWQASRDRYTELLRVDFFNVDDFLIALAIELGCPEEIIHNRVDRQSRLELIVELLEEFKFLVIVDDVDTLEDSDQQSLYYLISTIFAQAKSKALMTARRNLGMPRGQYIELGGIDQADFQEFVATKCRLLRIPFPGSISNSDVSELFTISGGSPLFVVSILRLMSFGVPFKAALKDWRGAAGENVRDAAFSREVSRLSVAEARLLLAAVYLRETSSVELAAVLKASAFEVSNWLDKLRDFSMVEVASALPGGATIIIPRTLTLMANVIEARVSNHQNLQRSCAEQRRLHEDPVPFVRDAIRRCMANLRNNDALGAVKVAAAALEHLPSHPDLVCMMGRCKMELGDGENRREAIELFRSAAAQGCRRSELYEFWIRTLQEEKDWANVITVCTDGESKIAQPGRFTVLKSQAYASQGESYLRANRYSDAERIFLQGAEAIKGVLAEGVIQIYRSDARQEQKSLIRKWLHTVSLDCPTDNECGRLLGAVLKAANEYNWLDLRVAERTTAMAFRMLTSISARKAISQTAREITARNLQRFSALSGHIERLCLSPDLNKAISEIEALSKVILSRGTT
ncbi:AlbA family DNA-binding domain-containing protein [Acidocella aquatica]|uniref:AlbA family DNA-binding domain-containing protein n=1 Tax=Acidocella aquatica TaxID=1922313 RepID=UPI0024E0953C|nr:ATP-binding protein [Acidocella aquatica]